MNQGERLILRKCPICGMSKREEESVYENKNGDMRIAENVKNGI